MTVSPDNSFHCSWRWFCAVIIAFQYHFGIAAMANENARAGVFMQQAAPQESKKFVLRGVCLHRGTTEIAHESLPVLETAVELLQERPTVWIRIEGHTDWPGSTADNQRLSEQWAQAVKGYLVRHGIDPSHLTTVGYGASQPLTDDRSDEDRAMNRRIVLKIVEEAEK